MSDFNYLLLKKVKKIKSKINKKQKYASHILVIIKLLPILPYNLTKIFRFEYPILPLSKYNIIAGNKELNPILNGSKHINLNINIT